MKFQPASARHRLPALLAALVLPVTLTLTLTWAQPARAQDNKAVIDALEAYLDFVDYGGATIFPEQIPKEDWARFQVIDARDKAQFDASHIPGAIHIEWRRVMAERAKVARDRPVLIYCNTGSLSAQAGLALRLAGFENLRILQGGYAEWKAKGGFDAASRAGAAPRH